MGTPCESRKALRHVSYHVVPGRCGPNYKIFLRRGPSSASRGPSDAEEGESWQEPPERKLLPTTILLHNHPPAQPSSCTTILLHNHPPAQSSCTASSCTASSCTILLLPPGPPQRKLLREVLRHERTLPQARESGGNPTVAASSCTFSFSFLAISTIPSGKNTTSTTFLGAWPARALASCGDSLSDQ